MKKNMGELHILQDRRKYIDMGRNGPLSEAERNRCVVQHMELVAPVAQKYRGGSTDWDDLLAAGREGLILAARCYDPSKSAFVPHAVTRIDFAIRMHIRSAKSQWLPKETDVPLVPVEGDKIERIFEWAAWGEFGNALALYENWLMAGATPEEIAIAYDRVKHRKDRFAAAFISLTSIQRKMVRKCYMQDPKLTIESAAREIGISRFRASRSLKKALETMREVIKRADDNDRLKSFAVQQAS